MTAYSKLIAAVLSVLVMRWFLRWSGIDLAQIGVEGEVGAIVSLLVDSVAAGVTGFFVWLVPNVKMKLSALWAKVKAWGWPWVS